MLVVDLPDKNSLLRGLCGFRGGGSGWRSGLIIAFANLKNDNSNRNPKNAKNQRDEIIGWCALNAWHAASMRILAQESAKLCREYLFSAQNVMKTSHTRSHPLIDIEL